MKKVTNTVCKITCIALILGSSRLVIESQFLCSYKNAHRSIALLIFFGDSDHHCNRLFARLLFWKTLELLLRVRVNETINSKCAALIDIPWRWVFGNIQNSIFLIKSLYCVWTIQSYEVVLEWYHLQCQTLTLALAMQRLKFQLQSHGFSKKFAINPTANLTLCGLVFQITFCELCFNTLRPRQNGPNFADDDSKCIFWNDNISIWINISPKFVPKGPINNILALFHRMALCHGDKPSSEPIVASLPTHICVSRPQWVNKNTPIVNSSVVLALPCSV